jgi:uncharacterized protein (DUF2461 family)
MSSWPVMTQPMFNGFPAEAFAWFAGLQADNSKGYFTANRATYDAAVRGPLEAMLDELAEDEHATVKMFRQHCDIRFSTDKSPYKTTTHGVIRDRPRSSAPLYAQLSATGLFAGTGYYRMDITRSTALGHVRSVWQAAAAINAWLDRHVGPG